MSERDELEQLRKAKRLRELEARAGAPAAAPQARGVQVYDQPVGPEQAGFMDRAKAKLQDPERWKAIAGMDSPYATKAVTGAAPMALPAQAVPKLASLAQWVNSMRLGRVAASAGAGAAESAIDGGNAKGGALLGAGIQGAAEMIPVIGKALKGKGAEKAFKATGAMLRDFRKAHGKGRVQEIGQQLLDDKVVTPLATHSDVAERAAKGVKAKGAELDSILTELGEAEQRMAGPGTKAGIDRKAIAASLRKELVNPNLDIPGVAAKNEKVQSLISQFEGGDDLIGILKGEELKRSVGKEIKWDRLPTDDIPIEEQVRRALYTKLKQGVEDSADVLEKLQGGPSADRFITAKKGYGNLEEAARIAKDRVSRDAANRSFGLTDTISGGAGATAGAFLGGPVGAAAGSLLGAAANKAGRTFGNSLMATGFNSLGDAILAASPLAEIAIKSPAAVGAAAGVAASRKDHKNDRKSAIQRRLEKSR